MGKVKVRVGLGVEGGKREVRDAQRERGWWGLRVKPWRV